MENMGNNVIIHCRATGFPKPRINWFVNGQITSSDPSSINDKYQILPNGDLFIHNSTFDDMGVYQCMASNEFGSDSIDEIFFYPTMVCISVFSFSFHKKIYKSINFIIHSNRRNKYQ